MLLKFKHETYTAFKFNFHSLLRYMSSALFLNLEDLTRFILVMMSLDIEIKPICDINTNVNRKRPSLERLCALYVIHNHVKITYTLSIRLSFVII